MRYVEVPRPRRPEPKVLDPYVDAEAGDLLDDPLEDEPGNDTPLPSADLRELPDACEQAPGSETSPQQPQLAPMPDPHTPPGLSDAPISDSCDSSSLPQPGLAPADSEP
jgi:hypothetical protein